MNLEDKQLKPEHIRYGRIKDLADIFGATEPQICRWDNGGRMTEMMLERAAESTGLSKGQIIDAYDLRRKDIKGKKSEDWIRWQSELKTFVNEAIA